MLIIGAVGLVLDQPLLFPSLGPSIFLATVTPEAENSTFWNTVVGHSTGLFAGFASLYLFHAQSTPAVLNSETLSVERVAATAVALALTIGLQFILHALHPPAAATTMLITLGGLKPSWRTISVVCLGVMLVAIFGVILRKWRAVLRM